MNKKDKFGVEKGMGELLACGRSADEQLEWIRKYGNHGMAPLLRGLSLAAHGIPRPKEKASNAVIFGCYLPFSAPFLLRDYVKLLDLLGEDYTYLDQEFCCGVPIMLQGAEEDRGKIATRSREVNQQNVTLARERGAATLAYCCVGCSHAAKSFYADEADKHIYILDLILSSMGQRPLKVAPMMVGYFEGCHAFYKAKFPQVSLNWKRYRQLFDRIEGLKVVDLPNNFCCKQSPGEIIGKAEELSLTRIVCACNGCYNFLGEPAKGRVEIMSFPQLLVESLGA